MVTSRGAASTPGFLALPPLARPCILVVLLLATGCRTLTYPAEGGPSYLGAPAEGGDGDPQLRIVSYNIACAVRVDLAMEALTQPPLAGADILALQEMDAPGVEAIGRRLGYGWVYFPVTVHPRTHRDFGNALLSPWPMRNARKLVLPHKSLIYNQGRAATVADIDVAGRTLRVYSTHLGAPGGTTERKRRAQVNTILEDAEQTSLPVVVLGDLNSEGIARHVEALGYTWITRESPPTAHRPRLDHILIRGLTEARDAQAGTWRDGPAASDHHPIWAVLPALSTP